MKKNQKFYILLSLLVITSLVLGLLIYLGKDSFNIRRIPKIVTELENVTTIVHYVDVGQADGIVIENSGHFMVIDAGTNAASKTMVSYLKSLNAKVIDVVIGTHPHEDHIGGLDDVIKNFEVKRVYMPKYAATTKSYEDVLKAIKNSKLTISNPTIGTEFELGTATVTIFGPVKTYDDANNNSIGVKLTDGNISYIFFGDAEKTAERDVLNTKFNLQADVYKVSHHGSYTSNTKKFVEAISPSVAIISVGKDNDYGYPHKEILRLFQQMGIKVYRTDESKTIMVLTNGTDIEVILAED